MSKIVIGQQFQGPPNSGNGGYVCGILARDIEGPATAILRARAPLDVELDVRISDGMVLMTDAQGGLIGKGEPAARATLPTPPAPPSIEAARAAGARCIGLQQRVHPTCFSCGPQRAEGEGLRVFVGQIESAPTGHAAGVWAPAAVFCDADGLATVEVVWAALDCPGYFAWVEKEGRHGALLGTMTGEILRRPRAGEECIVVAWPLLREGRKELAGVALFSAAGELMARAQQVWIVMQAQPASGVTPAAVSA